MGSFFSSTPPTPTPTRKAPKIIPITSPAHIPALAHVKQLAFIGSPMTHAMYPRDPRLIEEWFIARESVAMRDPKQFFYAAVRDVQECGDGDAGVDEESCIYVDEQGEGRKKKYVVLAWAKWTNLIPRLGQRENGEGEKGEVDGVNHADSQTEAGAAGNLEEETKRLWSSPDALPKGSHVEFVRAFKETMKETKKRLIDEEKDCVLDLLCTNPTYERQGHGRALLKHGSDIADENGVRVYLEATNVGLPLYERLGWRPLERMEWALSDFGVKGEGDKDGKLMLTGMIRDPEGGKTQEV